MKAFIAVVILMLSLVVFFVSGCTGTMKTAPKQGQWDCTSRQSDGTLAIATCQSHTGRCYVLSYRGGILEVPSDECTETGQK